MDQEQQIIASKIAAMKLVIPPGFKMDDRFEKAIWCKRDMYPLATICAICEFPWAYHFGECCPKYQRKHPSDAFVFRGTYFLPLLEVENVPMEFEPA